MPSPPIIQWRRRQTRRACQVNKAGRKAKRAPTWSPAIQSKGPQATYADLVWVVTDVLMLSLRW
jgi:hypothetical protein